jgi:hypothetical protein
LRNLKPSHQAVKPAGLLTSMECRLVVVRVRV